VHQVSSKKWEDKNFGNTDLDPIEIIKEMMNENNMKATYLG